MRMVRPQVRSILLRGMLCSGALVLLVCGLCCGDEAGPSRNRLSAARVEPKQGGFAYVELRAAHHWPSLRLGERGELELGAMFVHHWGSEREDVAQQLGVRMQEQSLTPGTCVKGGDLFALPLGDFDEDAGEFSVELMDAGRILFALPGRSELLAGDVYPEVLPNVSGQHYRRVFPLGTKSVSTRRVSVLGLGGRDVSAFELAGIRGPLELRWVSVGGWAPADSPVVVSARDPLKLRWTPNQPRFETRVRLRWPARVHQPAGELVCRPAADGRLVINRSWLRRIPLVGMSRELTLTVETTARVTTQGPLPGGLLLQLSQSDSVTLQLIH